MTDAEKQKLPKWLAERIPLVSATRSRRLRKQFREQRLSVVLGLRERGYPDKGIAQLLGVSMQYMRREYPKVKPAQETTT